MSEKLLTRNQFRLSCFKRDGFKCVVCKEPAVFDNEGEPTNLDAHHISILYDIYCSWENLKIEGGLKN